MFHKKFSWTLYFTYYTIQPVLVFKANIPVVRTVFYKKWQKKTSSYRSIAFMFFFLCIFLWVEGKKCFLFLVWFGVLFCFLLFWLGLFRLFWFDLILERGITVISLAAKVNCVSLELIFFHLICIYYENCHTQSQTEVAD